MTMSHQVAGVQDRSPAAYSPYTGMQRVAVIDMGSNTSKLILMAYEPGRRFKLIDELRQVVRLGQGMGEDNIIRADAFERGIEALLTFRAYCDAVGVEEICATATSAVRSAVNGESFLRVAREQAGLELEVLSGEEEAHYGAIGVANALDIEDALVLDIGGGSAQLSRLQQRVFVEGTSWPIGAVRMTDRFLTSDPPKKKEIKALTAHIHECLADTPEGTSQGQALVGLGGTIRNLAKIQKRKENYPVDLLNGYLLGRDALESIVEALLSRSVAERRKISGLKADRADIIAAGAVVVLEVVKHIGASGLLISGQGLREGVFYRQFLDASPPLIEPLREFSVQNVARGYYDHPAHNEHVRKLSLELFDQLREVHGYGPFERDVLSAAAILHDIGMAISYYDHHKHGFYLLMGASLPGFDHREQALIALLIRYHRKGSPNDQGLADVLLEGDMTRVEGLAGMLRLAEYLERSKAQRVAGVRCHAAPGYVQVEALVQGDARVEVQEASARSDLLASALSAQVDVVIGHG